jgi:N-acyl-D-aspartate/D-glutamate deacylase
VLSLEEAVRKMTSWPASRLGMFDRGVIREGLWADIVIFDLETIQDEADWRDGLRTPTGIDYVLVNGVVVVDHGRHTGARPGRIIRGRGASSAATGATQ